MSSRPAISLLTLFPWTMIIATAPNAQAQFTQQGGPLSYMNGGVAISADGNTAIIGDFGHNNFTGGVLIFTRNNGVWSQQGSELVGSGAIPSDGFVSQGSAVALSADGKTALVGGPFDGGDSRGAVWVFTRSNGQWTQQGGKLVGSGAASYGMEGDVVALSADGNTALIGNGSGAVDSAYIFTRSNGIWTQQGGQLTGTHSGCFDGVSLSADGNTALVGDFCDGSVGAGLVFTRSGGIWTQQGKLAGTGAVGDSVQGISVALSSDGNTALIGGDFDNNNTGAAWVFTRSNGIWSQQGGKLTASNAVGPASPEFGRAVALSGDGNTALIVGPADSNYAGATWVFRRINNIWTQQSKLNVGGGQNSVAISADGGTAILGDIQAFVFAQPHLTFLTPASATGGAPFNFIVSAIDANNQLLVNYSGVLHFSSSDPAATLPADSSLSAGLRNLSATLRTGGNQFLTATDTLIAGTSPAIAVTAMSSSVAQLGVFRTSGSLGVWAFDSNGNYNYDSSDRFLSFGLAGDQPVAGDWTGNGQIRMGVFRGGLWYLDLNNNGQWDGVAGGDGIFAFGLPGDTAVVGDWNGDGRTKLGIFHCPQTGVCTWALDFAGKFAYDAATARFYSYGLPGDLPVVNNWNGASRIDQIGVYRALPNGLAVWIVDSNGSGVWEASDGAYQFGLASDLPVVGNWNNGLRKRIGVFRNGTWILDSDGNNAYDVTDGIAFFGSPGDRPVTGNWAFTQP